MTGPEIAAVICRELRALERELNAYQSEEQVWARPRGPAEQRRHAGAAHRGQPAALRRRRPRWRLVRARPRRRVLATRRTARGADWRSCASAEKAVRETLDGPRSGAVQRTVPAARVEPTGQDGRLHAAPGDASGVSRRTGGFSPSGSDWRRDGGWRGLTWGTCQRATDRRVTCGAVLFPVSLSSEPAR